MAGKNNFYPYGESSTNILNNSEYQTDQERTAGAARGAIARSKIYNKVLRQSAAGAYAVADLVAATGKDADDASAATLAENFRAAVSYQARAFVASDVSVSGGLATATVDELATTAKGDLPALFSLAMVLDQSLPAGASIKIASSLPDTDLTFPIYSGGEVLEDDVITAGAISLMIDTIGGKAFFRAGGMGKLPSDLAPLCPGFKVERNGTKVKISADKIQLNPYTNMVQGGVWAWGKTRPTKPTGENTKQWSRAELITTPIRALADGTYDLVPDDPALSAQGVSTMAAAGTPVQLKDIPVSTAGNAVILKIPETDGEQNYIYLRKGYDGADTAGTLMREDPDSQSLKFNTTPAKNAYPYYMSELDSYAQNFESKLDASVVSQLVEGQVFCGVISTSENKTMARKIFVASEKEMGISTVSTYPEGTAFDYFASNESRVAKYSYFTRSTNMSGGSNQNIMVVLSDGSYGLKSQTSSYYMRPIILVSLDAWFTDNGDGTYTFVGDEPEPTEHPLEVEIDWPESDPLIARQWVYNTKGQYQTMLLGGVASTEDAPAYSPVLSENTWEQIAQACADRDPILESWLVGDEKDEVINGETITFVIVGKDHDDLADGSGKAPLTFGMKNLMAETRQMNSSNTNSGSFAGSAMYSWLSGTIYPNLPTELKDAIKAVNKKTSAGDASSSIRTDPMYLWLFSEIEVFGTTTYSYAGEGTQYPYFATASERIKRLSNGAGNPSYWWERSPFRNTSRHFCHVDPSGSAYNPYLASVSSGVCFGFCI